MDPRFMTYNSGPLWLLILIMFISTLQYFKSSSGENDDEEEPNLVEGLVNYQDALKEDEKNSTIG